MGQPRPPRQAARPGHCSPQLPQAEAPGSTGHSVRRVLSTPPAGATSQHRIPRSLGTADLGHTRSHLPLTGTQPAPGKGTFSKHTSSILATRSLRQEQKEMLGGKSTATQDEPLGSNAGAGVLSRHCRPQVVAACPPESQPASRGPTDTSQVPCLLAVGAPKEPQKGHLRLNPRRILRGATGTRGAVWCQQRRAGLLAGHLLEGRPRARLEGRVG